MTRVRETGIGLINNILLKTIEWSAMSTVRSFIFVYTFSAAFHPA